MAFIIELKKIEESADSIMYYEFAIINTLKITKEEYEQYKELLW